MKNIFPAAATVAALLPAAALLLAACGDSTKKTAPTAPTPAPATGNPATGADAPASGGASAAGVAGAATGDAAKTAAAKPAAITRPVADADGSFDPATDPVLGWWRTTIGEAGQERLSVLWPQEATDARALRTVRFLNDNMATNGCCAGAVWTRLDTNFCRVEREIHELYYAPDSATLWFLERADADAATAVFKKITDALAAGVTPESLAAKGLARNPAKFRRME
ncbi:MAG: hypothetical protein LBT53_07225 [Puniceicoccales bacterium]|jgi:hypothetical protein|nr:hypothetical protein [Puniceicoccales bacterium]